jgi:hypothetical protein
VDKDCSDDKVIVKKGRVKVPVAMVAELQAS